MVERNCIYGRFTGAQLGFVHHYGSTFVPSMQAYVARHTACPFGAVASVYAWERFGAALAHLARVYLKIPVLRYVDDYFGPERHVCFIVCVCVCSSQLLE